MDVDVDLTQPPTYHLSNGKELEEFGEEEIELEESCQEVEVIQEKHKGVELARPLETSPQAITIHSFIQVGKSLIYKLSYSA